MAPVAIQYEMLSVAVRGVRRERQQNGKKDARIYEE